MKFSSKNVLCMALLVPSISFAGDCLVIGDSIAKVIGQSTKACDWIAKDKWTTKEILENLPIEQYERVLISTGLNDVKVSRNELGSLKIALFSKLTWVIPFNKESLRKIILDFEKNGDLIVDLKKYEMSKDKIHPTANSYKEIAKIFEESK